MIGWLKRVRKARNRRAPHISHTGWEHKVALVLVAIVIASLWNWLVFDYGRQRAGFYSVAAAKERSELLSKVQHLNDEKNLLRSELIRLKRSGAIDLSAIKLAQKELVTIQTERQQLQKELGILQQLIAKGQGALHIDSIRLEAGEDAQTYRYQIVVAQILKKIRQTKGSLSFKVSGRQGKKTVNLSHKTLVDGNKNSIPIKFRNFQNLEGIIKLPVGFKPRLLTVSVRAKDKRLNRVNRSYDWKMGEL